MKNPFSFQRCACGAWFYLNVNVAGTHIDVDIHLFKWVGYQFYIEW